VRHLTDVFRLSTLFESITDLLHEIWILRIDVRLFAKEMRLDLPLCYVYTVIQDSCYRLMDLYEERWKALRIVLSLLIDVKMIEINRNKPCDVPFAFPIFPAFLFGPDRHIRLKETRTAESVYVQVQQNFHPEELAVQSP
jgi:hypothetical protein